MPAHVRLQRRRVGPVEVVVKSRAPRADDEAADATRVVALARLVERRELLVVVLVRADDHVGAGVVQRVPQRRDVVFLADFTAALESRIVPVGQRAARGVRGEIGDKPRVLRRAGGAGDRLAPVARVQRHDVPRPDVEAVVALAARSRDPRRRAHAVEVVEVPLPLRLAVFVVAGDRMREREQIRHTPARRIVGVEVGQRAVRIRLVAERQDRRRPSAGG